MKIPSNQKLGFPGGELTTNHAASSYGIPILLISGIAYGPLDHLPGKWQIMDCGMLVRSIIPMEERNEIVNLFLGD